VVASLVYPVFYFVLSAHLDRSARAAEVATSNAER
jgi:hypothetical protein